MTCNNVCLYEQYTRTAHILWPLQIDNYRHFDISLGNSLGSIVKWLIITAIFDKLIGSLCGWHHNSVEAMLVRHFHSICECVCVCDSWMFIFQPYHQKVRTTFMTVTFVPWMILNSLFGHNLWTWTWTQTISGNWHICRKTLKYVQNTIKQRTITS